MKDPEKGGYPAATPRLPRFNITLSVQVPLVKFLLKMLVIVSPGYTTQIGSAPFQTFAIDARIPAYAPFCGI